MYIGRHGSGTGPAGCLASGSNTVVDQKWSTHHQGTPVCVNQFSGECVSIISCRYNKAKKSIQGNPDVLFDEAGNIYDSRSNEFIGNIMDFL